MQNLAQKSTFKNEDHGFWSHAIMASRWGKQWKRWETLFSWLQNRCRWWLQHKIERYLLLGRKAMTNLDRIFKNRDITLPPKVFLVQAIIFPVVVYGCENWTIQKAEPWKIDAFEVWCWRRLLWVPWTAREYNYSVRISVLNIYWKDWC